MHGQGVIFTYGKGTFLTMQMSALKKGMFRTMLHLEKCIQCVFEFLSCVVHITIRVSFTYVDRLRFILESCVVTKHFSCDVSHLLI